ncbi:MAG: cation:proton antiporter [Planctomycetes bacterium]|nr:cation:proton antiporter [Planctomycetota bacterium]
MSPLLAAAGGPLGEILLSLVVILLAAKVGGELSVRAGLPTVLGELVMGILLGNLALTGWHGLEFLKHQPVLAVLAEIGVILLLFEVGVESTVPQMLRVGPVALLVAVVGVVVPTGLGLVVAKLFFPNESFYAHLFIGTVLCATSVGITARVLKEIRKSDSAEAKIIVGAAVIDDILGMILLATVTGMILAAGRGSTLSVVGVAWIAGKAVLFLVGAIVVGLWLAPRMYAVATRLRSGGWLLPLSLAFCFALSFLAELAGLAALVGAFTAGLILEDVQFRDLATKEEYELHDLLHPVIGFFLPIFFVLMGLRVDARAFAQTEILLFAGILTAVAIVGKHACGVVVWGGRADRWAVGLGMIPRGEVGLVFAGVGTTLVLGNRAVVTPAVFSACVIMVVLTTFVTPPLLKWRFGRLESR